MRGKYQLGVVLCGLVLAGCQPPNVASEQKMLKSGRDLLRAIQEGDVEKAKQLAHFYWVPILPEPHKIPMGYKCFFPLHAATGAGEVEIVKALIAKGADVNVRDDFGKTPIMWAVDRWVIVRDKTLEELNHSHIACFRELVKAGADINAGARDGWTALHYVSFNLPQIMPYVHELIKLGADVNRTSTNGETPLHAWCRLTTKVNKRSEQFHEGVRYVLEHGADVRIKDKEGRYAEHWLNEQVPEEKELIDLIREVRRKQESAHPASRPPSSRKD
jgi:ankyrin repeat protein